MYEAEFPIFSIHIINSQILAAGGGGREEFGKKNGLILLNLEFKYLNYFQTEDMIKKMEIRRKYSRNLIRKEINEDLENETESESDKIDIKKEDNIDLEDDVENDDLDSNDTVKIYKKEINQDKTYWGIDKKTKISNIEGELIALLGTDYLYLLTLIENQFNLIFKKKIIVDNLFLGNYIIFTSKGKLFGFTDLNIQEKMDIKKGVDKNNYLLCKVGNEVKPFYNEELGNIEGWCNFFIIGNRIYKIKRSEGNKELLSFKYKGINYSGDIKGITFNKKLVYYTKDENKLFIDENVYKISKISCLNIKDNRDILVQKGILKNYDDKSDIEIDDVNDKIKHEYELLKKEEFVDINVLCGSGDGIVYLIGRKKFIKKVSELPITSIDMKGKFIYFSSFDGTIRKIKVQYIDKRNVFTILLLIIIVCWFFYHKMTQFEY